MDFRGLAQHGDQRVLGEILHVDIEGELHVQAVHGLDGLLVGVHDPVAAFGQAHRLEAVLAPEDRVAAAFDADGRYLALVLDVAERAEAQAPVRVGAVIHLDLVTAAPCAAFPEDGEGGDFLHLLIGQQPAVEEHITAAALEAVLAALDNLFLVLGGFLVFVEIGQADGQRIDSLGEDGGVGLHTVHAHAVFRDGKGQVAAVIGQDAAAGAGEDIVTHGLGRIVPPGLVDELQVDDLPDGEQGQQHEAQVEDSDFPDIDLHTRLLFKDDSFGRIRRRVEFRVVRLQHPVNLAPVVHAHQVERALLVADPELLQLPLVPLHLDQVLLHEQAPGDKDADEGENVEDESELPVHTPLDQLVPAQVADHLVDDIPKVVYDLSAHVRLIAFRRPSAWHYARACWL